ncbi:MAG TPA: cupin domain-containing protein [Gammaproteobacteria bacterium]|jgi:transcriptional regulator with XRE-family HTH domain|nr:cupin domain-containing protein [Gammaproteobacteria bacterium]
MGKNSTVIQEDPENKLGGRLRLRRKKLKLSMKEVAISSGLSIGFISQVERGLTSPSLTSLTAIANFLRSDVTNFLSQPKSKSSITRHQERDVYTINKNGLQYERLSDSFPGHTLNSVIIHEMPGHRSESISHEGEEFFFILEGAITIYIDGVVNILEAGDSLHFDSSRSHSAWNHTNKVTTVLHVCTMNVFGDQDTVKDIPGIFDCRGNLIFSKDHSMDLNIHSGNK